MTSSLSAKPGPFCRAVVLVGITALIPLPLAAADNGSPGSTHPLQAAITKHAASEAAKVSAPRTNASRQTASSNDPRSGGFLHSPAGIACIAVLAAGTGYAVYSANHDRIHSVVRQGQ